MLVSLVTMESSGHDWMPLASHLRRRDAPLALVNSAVRGKPLLWPRIVTSRLKSSGTPAANRNFRIGLKQPDVEWRVLDRYMSCAANAIAHAGPLRRFGRESAPWEWAEPGGRDEVVRGAEGADRVETVVQACDAEDFGVLERSLERSLRPGAAIR